MSPCEVPAQRLDRLSHYFSEKKPIVSVLGCICFGDTQGDAPMRLGVACDNISIFCVNF